MGLFDLFKKKPKAQNNQETLNLEEFIKKVQKEPSLRFELYPRLLNEHLVLITMKSNLKDGQHTIEQDSNVNIVSYPDGSIPMFSSTDRIFDKGVIKEQVSYILMKGQNLFEYAKGATLILNPYSDFRIELQPAEIENILTSSSESLPQNFKIEKNTNIQIGQPAKYPTEIVNALKTLFETHPTIKAAYLGWIYQPESGEPAHLIFGLDADGELNVVFQEASLIVSKYLDKQDFADFIKIDDNFISDYFLNKTVPFYIK
jgi:hypothetical protein